MSSTESSGAPAEATETTPASAAFPSFGSTRGSGLARGKRPSSGPTAAAAAPSAYTPTAIEIVNAPREYKNPFAPETPEPAAEAAPEPVARVETPSAPAAAPAASEPAVSEAPVISAENAESAELNILPPEEQKAAPAQTWESDGFRPSRESRSDRPDRSDRPRRQERGEGGAPRQEIPTPEKFLYVRPGHHYVPTPSNYGGAPRTSAPAPAANEAHARAETPAPAKSGGFIGWLKSLFDGAPAATGEATEGESRRDGRPSPGRQRGGRGQHAGGGGGGGQRRRRRGGRSRSRGEYRGGDHGGPAAT